MAVTLFFWSTSFFKCFFVYTIVHFWRFPFRSQLCLNKYTAGDCGFYIYLKSFKCLVRRKLLHLEYVILVAPVFQNE